MKKQKAVLVGDTRYFHVGSYTNCKYLTKILSEKYDFLGIFGDERYIFKDYNDFVNKINNHKSLYISLYEAEHIFLNGEGYIEKNSPYAEALYYTATYVKALWPNKKIHLINFSCFDSRYWDWEIFDTLTVRDKGSLKCLGGVHKNIDLGFDCSILQNKYLPNRKDNKSILVFRGRKDITTAEIGLIKNTFKNKNIYTLSCFWLFDHDSPIQTQGLKDLQCMLKDSFLVVSSSFHGIIFSICFGIPFIPIETIGTMKNTSVSEDILGSYYKKRNLKEWLEFYSKTSNYDKVRNILRKIFVKLQKRAYKYLGLPR